MFAKNLKYLRERQGIDQQSFAKIVNRSVSTVSEWESGKYTPKAGILADIANYFGVRLDDMMGKDLSVSNDDTIQKTVAVMKQLNIERQRVVYHSAEAELAEQNEPVLIAAHTDDNLTEEQQSEVNDFIAKIKREHEQ